MFTICYKVSKVGMYQMQRQFGTTEVYKIGSEYLTSINLMFQFFLQI